MNKFVLNSFTFILIYIVAVNTFTNFTDEKLNAVYGPNTEQQIRLSFKYALEDKYDLVVLGNSRIYRGVNPDKLSIKAYNFAHDNDSFNQIYYKLKYLEKNNNLPEHIILGVDYFQFSFLSDTRNYVYGRLLGREYMKDFNTSYEEYINKLISVKQNQFVKRFETVVKPQGKQSKVPYLKKNGQYIRFEVAKETDSVKRDSNMLDVQVEYFNKILDYCDKNKIEVFMIMPPVRKNEMKSYDEETIRKFNIFFNERVGNMVHFLNYSISDQFTIKDFQDITHLNVQGADKFTKLLDKDIRHIQINN